MSLQNTRRDIKQMLKLMQETGFELVDLAKYCISTDDKETTLFDAVRDAFDDWFEDDLAEEAKTDRDQWDEADEAYEKWRDAQ